MEWSRIRRLGPGGAIPALTAHFETFAFARYEHD
jgi:hypothetical protein